MPNGFIFETEYIPHEANAGAHMMTKEPRSGTVNSEKPASSENRYFSRAIGNALRILEMIQLNAKPIALAEVARQVKLPKSSVFRTLRTLEIAGYLQRHEDDRFSPAPGTEFGHNQMVRQVVAAAEPLMKSLSQEFRETISLAFLFHNRIEVVAVIDSPHRVAMGNTVGDLIPPHASSLGKCIAALQPEPQRTRLLRTFSMVRFTPRTVTDEMELRRDLEVIKKQGYATDMEESVMGGCCLSSAILAANGQAIAAISISMPKLRFLHQKRLVMGLKDATRSVTQLLKDI
jgi:IclR family acetate operon transcriptional repressor